MDEELWVCVGPAGIATLGATQAEANRAFEDELRARGTFERYTGRRLAYFRVVRCGQTAYEWWRGRAFEDEEIELSVDPDDLPL